MYPLLTQLLLIVSLLSLAFPAAGQDARYTAYVARSGEITLRRTGSERPVAWVRPGLFEKGWQYRTVSGGPAAGETEAIEGIIRASDGKTVVRVREKVEAEGSRLRVRCEMTPDGPLAVNSVHVSVSVPVAPWIGAQASVGTVDRLGTRVPARASATQLIGGNVSRLTLEKPGMTLTVDGGEAGPPVILQDNRVFNGTDLEIRFGAQDGNGRAWPAGKTETFTITVDAGGPVVVEREKPMTLEANAEWIPLDLKLDIAPGSALDFSFLNDAPAGKYGSVVVRPDGHFGFERGPERPVRFYGVNLCFSANYPDHETADRLADRLARIGYNTVRIHHYESELVDGSAKDSLTFRADSLDRLDYLAAALKKRGLYLKTDLFVSRPVREGEMPGKPSMDDFKLATLVSEKALDNWKAFARKLLTHVNPYTGLAWKDDPALAFLSMVNEDIALCYLGGLKGELKDLFQQRWEAWLKARYDTDAKLASVWGDPGAKRTAPMPVSDEPTPRGRDLARFVTTLHEKTFAAMRDFLRGDLGTRALLTDLNGWMEHPTLMAARAQLDWVDNHFYWDHPSFLGGAWGLPSKGGSGGGSAVEAGGAGPVGLTLTRLMDRPFSVSEYNYAAPNPCRAEGGLLMGATAALQGWDAVWRFAYSHSRDSVKDPAPLNYFDMAGDPAGQASERAALTLFLRGDARAAPDAVTLVRSRADLMEGAQALPNSSLSDLALVARVGVRVSDEKHPIPAASPRELYGPGDAAGALAALRSAGRLPGNNRTDLMKGIRESETGEALLDSERGLLVLTTPRTVGGTAPAGETLQAGPFTVKISGTRAAVWASSLDGQPVTRSRRLLLVHVTDVQNSGMRYAGPDRVVLESWGGLPHLVRAGGAQVTLAHEAAAKLRAWRLDTAGRRVAAVPVQVTGDRAALTLATRSDDGKATLYYEIAVE